MLNGNIFCLSSSRESKIFHKSRSPFDQHLLHSSSVFFSTRYFFWLCMLLELGLNISVFIDEFSRELQFFFLRKDFIIYREPNASPSHVTENGFSDKVK